MQRLYLHKSRNLMLFESKSFDEGLSSLPTESPSKEMAARYITVATLAVSRRRLPIGLVDQLYLDVHLGKFNQHRQ